MTAENWLNSLRYLDAEITALDNMRVRLSDCRQDILDQAEGSALLTGVCVQTTPGSKTERLAIELALIDSPAALVGKLQELQDRVNKKIDLLVCRKQKTLTVIERIPDARHRAILIHRFLSNYKWATIADLMGYTQGWVEGQLKQDAIEAYELAENNRVKKGTISCEDHL